MVAYKEIFYNIEQSLKKRSHFSETEFQAVFGSYKHYENKTRTDEEVFQLLVMVIFYSGFRAATVEGKKAAIFNHFPDHGTVALYSVEDIQRILSDPLMIRNEKKVAACVQNARTFTTIAEQYGSFQNYMHLFHADSSFENLLLLKVELEYRFCYLGGTTVYPFLTDLGFPVLKPDRVILRLFKRLGLIESERQLLKSVIHGRQFAKETGLPIRYIDIVLVKYGQQGKSEEFGLSDGICLEETPFCNECGVSTYCIYEKKATTVINTTTGKTGLLQSELSI